MRLPKADASIKLHLLPTVGGGRRSSTPGRRWKCRLKLDGQFFDAMLVNRRDAPFHPGGDAEADVTFLQPDLVPQAPHHPRMVELWELQKVGTGALFGETRSVRAAS